MMSRARGSLSAILILYAGLHSAESAAGVDLVSGAALDHLGIQRYWDMNLPLAADEAVSRIELLDGNLYVLTSKNRVFAVHSRTGVIRWSTIVADEGLTIRGPSHAAQYVFFTTSGGVRVFSRQTGELASEPRTLRGVVIDVAHDTASLTIGRVHGVRNGDVLGIYRVTQRGELEPEPLGWLKVTYVEGDKSRGRLFGYDKRRHPSSGDRVKADITLPLEKVDLPFAASSAGVADDRSIYVGAANQRFYSLDILSGFQNWQLLTPKTVSSTPILSGEDLYIAGQDGRVLSCTKEGRKGNWIVKTDGPIFADLAIDGEHLYVASSDRSLYCLDCRTGERVWRDRFDTPLMAPPIVAHGRVYQQVPEQGLFVLDAKTGDHCWERPEGGQFLAQFEENTYLLAGEGAHRLVRVDAKSGREMAEADAGLVAFATGDDADQSILLAAKTGELTCLRSKNAPRLKPAQLAEVLRNDRRIRTLEELDARQRAEQARKKESTAASAKEKPRLNLFEEDWLRSSKKGKPIGGRGLVGVKEGEKEAKENESEEKEEEAEEADEDQDEDEGEDVGGEDEDEDEEADTGDEDEDEDQQEDEDEDDE
ncbi:MAG: PQQ-binding-like beta-propeller repeat protein [Phycisphaerae bacterium]|nr:PQQ-binding-like beta-propeller repeat protein [Phycisphaerae bacterium]